MEEMRIVGLLRNVSRMDVEMEQLQKLAADAQKSVQKLQDYLQVVELPLGELNLEVYLALIEQHPEMITPQLYHEFSKHGVNLTVLSPVAKRKAPDCLKIRNPFDDIAEAKQRAEQKAANNRHYRMSGQQTMGDIPNDSGSKGVIFVKCRPDTELENQMVDELVNVANERGIYIQDYIVNPVNAKSALQNWIGTDSIDVVLMHSMIEYSSDEKEQSELFRLAGEHDVSFLLGTMGYKPVYPSMDWFQSEC